MQPILDAWAWLFRTRGFIKRGEIPGWSLELTTAQTLADTALAVGLFTIAGLLWVFASRRGAWSVAMGAGPNWVAAALSLLGVVHALRVLGYWFPLHNLGVVLQSLAALAAWVAVFTLATTIPRFLRFLAAPTNGQRVNSDSVHCSTEASSN